MPGICAYQPSKRMRMLRRHLTASSRRHAHHHGHAELTSRHVAQSSRVIQDLIHGQHAEIHGHDLDDGPHAAECCTNSSADEGGLGKRSVADALGTEFFQKAEAHSKCPAVTAHILAHEENARVIAKSFSQRGAHRFAIGHPRHGFTGV